MSAAFGFADDRIGSLRPRTLGASGPKTERIQYDTTGWDGISEPLQLALARAALRRAAQTIATQADTLADEMAAGGLADRGGPDALRLFAALIRVTSGAGLAEPGSA